MNKIIVWLKKRKVLVISILLNILLLFSTGYYYAQNYEAELLLKRTVIPSHTYIHPQQNSVKTGGYYLSPREDRIEIKTFDRETILSARYKVIGNGVFELEDDLGYMVSDQNGLRMELKDEHPEVFDYYTVFIKMLGTGKR